MSSQVEEKPVDGLAEIESILADITFAPSCVDMDWLWEVKPTYDTEPPAYKPLLTGYLIRTTFKRPDRDSGKVNRGYGRWWMVGTDITLSGVVKTAFAASQLILTHEIMESFKWQGKRVFDPHNSVEALASLSIKK